MEKKKINKGDLPTVVETGKNPLAYKDEFDTICGIISAHKKRAMYAVHNESLNMLWEVGAYVSDRLKKAAWGGGVVRMLAEYIHTKSPNGVIVQYIKWYSSMKPIHRRGSTRLFINMVCNTTCQHQISENFLMRRRKLCQSNWHKFPSCCFLQDGATIS